MSQVIQETEKKLPGFCPQVLESFLVGAEIVFGGHDELRAVLEHLKAGRFALAVGLIKVYRYRFDESASLFEAVERKVYASICPHH